VAVLTNETSVNPCLCGHVQANNLSGVFSVLYCT